MKAAASRCDVPTAAVIDPAPAAEPAPRKRRLWQLPPQAHELLLALSFTPESLRREAARTLGQIHKGRCVLKGRDADVLYSLVHDLTMRNALAEAFQKHLDQRHALAVQRLTKLHDAEALQAAWAAALDVDDMPATLWALLTHPLGAQLETSVLYDARAWVFAHTRRSVGLAQAQANAESRAADSRLQADDLRGRLMAQERQAAQMLLHAQAEIARLNGELARVHSVSTAPSKPADAARRSAANGVVRDEVCDEIGATRATGGPRAPPRLKPAPPPPPPPPVVTAAAPEKPASPPIVVQGQRVLCVGGIQHAVARYRARIEKLGGQFEHHDGGLEDSPQALEGRLSRADVVICQAACINHEAYHRVKRHCERTGKPCVYLDRPSLSRFDRAITGPTHDLHAAASSNAMSSAGPKAQAAASARA